jgi:uncharacterized Ntn-hydrolase superfamily protein
VNRGKTCLLAVSILAVSREGYTTWSIAAVDPQTREVGVAGASCILGSGDPDGIAELVPGVGAVVAQAFTNLKARRKLAHLIGQGVGPDAALDAVTDAGVDALCGLSLVRLRQYGVVTLAAVDRPVSFTGKWAPSWSGAKAGHGVTVQGNSLWGPEVVDTALAAFEENGSACLAERLLVALEAGAQAGGDARCSRALSALYAFLVVARPEDTATQPSLRLIQTRPGEPPSTLWRVLYRMLVRPEEGTQAENPVFLLRETYERERPNGRAPQSCY